MTVEFYFSFGSQCVDLLHEIFSKFSGMGGSIFMEVYGDLKMKVQRFRQTGNRLAAVAGE